MSKTGFETDIDTDMSTTDIETEIESLKTIIRESKMRLGILMKKRQMVVSKSDVMNIRQIKKERFLRKLEIINIFKTILGINLDYYSRDHNTSIQFEIFGGFVTEFFKYNYYDDDEFVKEHDSDLDICIYKSEGLINICLEVIKRIQDINPMIRFTDIKIQQVMIKDIISDGTKRELTHVKCNCHYNGNSFKMDIFDNPINRIRSNFQLPYDYDINNIHLNLNANTIVFGNEDAENNIIGTMINIVNKEAICRMPYTAKLSSSNIHKTWKMIERQNKLQLLGYKPNVSIITVDHDTETECCICKSINHPTKMKPFKSCPCNEGENICMDCFTKCGLNKCPICKTKTRILVSRDKSLKLYENWVEIPEATHYGDDYIDGNITITRNEYTSRHTEQHDTVTPILWDDGDSLDSDD